MFVCIIDEPMNHIAWPDKGIIGDGIYEFLDEFESTGVVISHDPMVRIRGPLASGNQYIKALSFNRSPAPLRT